MKHSESVATRPLITRALLVWGAGDHRAIMVLIHHRPPCYASPPSDCTASVCNMHFLAQNRGDKYRVNGWRDYSLLCKLYDIDNNAFGIIIDKKSPLKNTVHEYRFHKHKVFFLFANTWSFKTHFLYFLDQNNLFINIKKFN